MATLSTYSTEVQFNNVYYNSEWGKLLLLLWKKSRMNWQEIDRKILIFVSPLSFVTILLLIRFLQTPNREPKTYRYPPLNTSIYWQELADIIDKRKAIINKELPEFTYNPFIPQKVVGWGPKDFTFQAIMESTVQSFKPMKLRQYKTCKELKKAVYEDHLFCGICLKNEYPLRDNRTYHFHGDLQNLIGIYPRYMCFHVYFPNNLRIYNDTFIGKTWELHSENSLQDKHRPRNIGLNHGGTPGYIREGFVHIQLTINRAYLDHIRLASKSRVELPEISIQRFPEQNYIRDDQLEKIDFAFSFMLILSKLALILNLVTEIVREKKHSRKPYYKVLGIGSYLHFIASLLKSFIISLANTICAVIVYKVTWMDGLAIMNRCTFLQLLSIFSVYNVTSIAFCLMITSFCTYEDTALLVTSFAWLTSYMPFLACVNGFTNIFNSYSNIFMVICHNTMMGFILELILDYEMYYKDQKFTGIYYMKHFRNDIALNTYLLLMLCQGIVYLLIGLYVESVLPHHFEFIRKWYRNRKNKRHNRKRDHRKIFGQTAQQPDTFIHEIGDKKVLIVDIKNISKKYDNEYVLRDISLQLYENEITALVGHNGCGKTTLIQLICGQLFPTSGYITIDGFNVIREQKVACASLGVCVQDSVLYDNLSVQDQLRFFSYLKAYDVMSVENDVLKYLHAINLYDKRNVITKDLPVGIRQELAICCALAGQSRIVLLDEPNALMDDESRYRSWELILSQKQGRTILITTTYIEVMMALADRVTVLSQGQLHCAGSPAFLTKIYGSGYRLIVVRKQRDDASKITEIIRNYLPNIEPASFLGYSTIYIIEERYFDRLKSILTELEANRQTLQIVKICLRQSNLYDIFYQMGTEEAPLENRNRLIRVMRGTIDDDLLFLSITERNEGRKAIKQRLRTILAMKYKLAISRKWEIIIFFMLPLLLVHMSYFISFFHFHNVMPKHLVFGSYRYTHSTTLLHIQNASITKTGYQIDYGRYYSETILWMGYKHVLVWPNRPIDEYISNKTYYEKYQHKVQCGATFNQNKIIAWFNNYLLHVLPLSINLIHQTLQRAIIKEYSNLTILIKTANSQPTYLDGQIRNGLSTGTILAVFITMIYTILLTKAVYNKINERENGIKQMQLLAGVSIRMYWAVNLAVDNFLLCIITSLVLFTIVMHQFAVLTSISLYVWLSIVMLLCGMTLFSFNYLVASYCRNASNGYIIVFTISCFAMVTYVHYNQGYENDVINTPRHQHAIFFMFIPHLLLCNAISTIYYVNYFRIICDNEHIRTISIYLEKCKAKPNCCVDYNYLDFENGIGLDLIMSIVMFCICWGLIILKESKYHRIWKPKISEDVDALLNDHVRRHTIVSDDIGKLDTFNETLKTQNITVHNRKHYPLICDRVGKFYGEVIGIERFSLALNKKEIFGIIGGSGSGVTTLYEMIAGRKTRNYGDIYVKGFCSFNDYNAIKNTIGYGQQHLELMSQLTVGGLLEYLCNLHCYPADSVQEISENLSAALGILQHYDKSLPLLSCGVVRLLTCAIAMLGKRELLVLDCITPDIDAAASKRLWNVLLNMNAKGTTILLTIRNFKDAENYCDRTCLMSFGICYKLASPRNLDTLYEDYHMVQVRFNMILNESKLDSHSRYMYYTSLDKLKKFMREEFQGAKYYRTVGNYMEFIIPLNSASLWQVFSTLRYNSYFLNIESYEITRLTYYQTFTDNVHNLIERHTRRVL